jgi:type VI secretion system protein ImpA
VDLGHHNDFLAMNLAVAGKPETQFSSPEPPDWRGAFKLAGEMLDRSRDLRIAIVWLRAGVRQYGLDFMPMGLRLLNGMLENLWDHLHD